MDLDHDLVAEGQPIAGAQGVVVEPPREDVSPKAPGGSQVTSSSRRLS